MLVPLSVTNLTLTQTDYPTDTNDTVDITVSWNHVTDFYYYNDLLLFLP